MKSKESSIEKDDRVIERIIKHLKYFSDSTKTYGDWLNDNSQKEDKQFFDLLFSQGLLEIHGLRYISLSENLKHTALADGMRMHKIIFVTKDGYIFLNNYTFNKRSIEINQEVKKISFNAFIVSIIALVISLISLIFAVYKR
jgi:hypothetical protein